MRVHECRLAFGGERAGLVGGDGDAGGGAEVAALQVEGPEVPGAHGAGLFDEARGEVPAGVGAGVVDDVDDALVEKHGELKAADLDVAALAFFEFVEVTEARPGHFGGEGKRGRGDRGRG